MPEIVCDSFVIADWTAQPGTSAEFPIAGLHLHRSDDEAWHVLDGRLGLRIDGEVHEIGPGESILVTRGQVHTYWNAQDQPTHYLLVMAPRIHALIKALHSGERSDYTQVFEEHDSELL